jgi:hypothetical protein
MTARTDAILGQDPAMPDWQVADVLNAQSGPPVLGDASIVAVQNVLLLAGDWGKIKVAAHGDNQQLAVLCENALALFESPDVSSIGFGDSPYVLPAITAMLDAMVSAGLVGAESRTAILAMAWVQTPLWTPPFTAREVGLARGSQ